MSENDTHTAIIETEYGVVFMESPHPRVASGQALRMARQLEQDRDETAALQMGLLQ